MSHEAFFEALVGGILKTGMTRRELSERAGVSPTFIARAANGQMRSARFDSWWRLDHLSRETVGATTPMPNITVRALRRRDQ